MRAIVFGLTILSFVGLVSAPVLAADLEIAVAQIKKKQGTLRVAVWKNSNGFPGKGEPFLAKEIPVKESLATIQFKSLDPGTYAISIFHDANDNKKLDRNLFGMPTEGYGFSNNVTGSFGPPSFDAAAFQLVEPDKKITIKLNN